MSTHDYPDKASKDESEPCDPSLVTGYESLTTSDKILVSTAFHTNGIATILAWNSVVNAFVALREIWPDQVFSNLLGGVEFSAIAVSATIMLWLNGLNASLIYISGIMNVLVTLLFPTVTYFFPGMENLTTAKPLLCLISAMAGVGSGLFMVVGISFASIMPFPNATPLVSSGYGMSGVVTFASFLLLSDVAFPKTITGRQHLLWAFFSVGTFVIMLHLVAFTILNRRPWFTQIVQQAILKSNQASCFSLCKQGSRKSSLPSQDTVQPEDSKEHWKDAPVACPTTLPSKDAICSTSCVDIDHDVERSKSFPPPRPIQYILKDCGIYLISLCISNCVTLFIFPLTGPYNWKQGPTMTTLLNGTYQVTNMVMRYAPAFRFLRIPRHFLLPVAILRALFIPLFLIPARFLPENEFVKHPATLFILMLLFAAMQGWCFTLAMMYTGEVLENPKEKATASKIIAICIGVSTLVGTFSSRLLVL